jgi:hypothetical protein
MTSTRYERKYSERQSFEIAGEPKVSFVISGRSSVIGPNAAPGALRVASTSAYQVFSRTYCS